MLFPAGREKCLVLLNSAETEQQVELSVQLQSPGEQLLPALVAWRTECWLSLADALLGCEVVAEAGWCHTAE